MADFRTIHTRIWTDAWFCELEPDEKLVFIYLFSNPNASVCGMYEMPKRNIALDVGISVDRVSKILNRFSEKGKVFYEDGIVWVVNLNKYNNSGDSVKVEARAKKDIEAISDCHIKKLYCEFNNIPYSETKIPYPENEHETDTETETETEKKGAQKPRRTVKPPTEIDPRKDHPAIVAIRTVCKKYPPKEAWDLIIGRLGDNPDIARLTLSFEKWVASGKNPLNYDGITDWYKNGIPEYKKPSFQQPSENHPYGPAIPATRR